MRFGFWAALALLAACDDGGTGAVPGDDDDSVAGDDDDDDSVPATGCAAPLGVTVGTGATSYEPLQDGASVTMVHGPQGGWHVETAGLVTASAVEVSVLPRIVAPSLEDLQIAGDQQPTYLALALYDAAVCEGQFYGVRAYLDDVDPSALGMNFQEFICSLEGVELELSVDVSDLSTQETASSSVTVVAQLDSSDVQTCASLSSPP
jgi:hypothetical protein